HAARARIGSRKCSSADQSLQTATLDVERRAAGASAARADELPKPASAAGLPDGKGRLPERDRSRQMSAKQLNVQTLLTGALLERCTQSIETDVESSTPVKVETVQSYPPSVGARYSASIIPGSQVPLAFSVGGYADRILQAKGSDGRLRNIQQGDSVARGQVLAGVRLKDYAVRVDQASGQLEQARASLVTSARQVTEVEVAAEKARLDFDRAQALYSTQSMTKSEYDAAKSQHDLYQAKIETAKSQLAFIKAQITAAEAVQTAATISRDDTLL